MRQYQVEYQLVSYSKSSNVCCCRGTNPLCLEFFRLIPGYHAPSWMIWLQHLDTLQRTQSTTTLKPQNCAVQDIHKTNPTLLTNQSHGSRHLRPTPPRLRPKIKNPNLNHHNHRPPNRTHRPQHPPPLPDLRAQRRTPPTPRPRRPKTQLPNPKTPRKRKCRLS